MEVKAFDLLRKAESSWWYFGRARAVESVLSHVNMEDTKTALDYGAGFGGMYPILAQYAQIIDAVEPDAAAGEVATSRGYRTVGASDQELLHGRYGLIGLFDVLEHIESDNAFLLHAKELLTSDGRIIVTVPAYMWLWSPHDVEHQHFRRYTQKSLTAAFEEAGYQVEFISYWNCAMLIPASILRLLGHTGDGGLTPPRLINYVLTRLMQCEGAVLKKLPLPFGLSVTAVARVRTKDTLPPHPSNLHTLFKYGIVGATGGLLQITTLYVWVDILHLSALYLLGSVVGFCIALIVTFLLQKYWTFSNRGSWRTGKQALSYSAVALSGLLLNALLLATAKWGIETSGHDFFNGWYLIVQIGAVAVVSVCNYLFNSRLTFKQ